MAYDPAARIAKWNAKYNTERIKATLDDMRPAMYASVQATFPKLVAMELKVKQVLDLEGVSVTQYPFYLSFGRELWRVVNTNEMAGESAAVEAAVLLAKWTARGYSQAVLENIRTGVFNISRPTTPTP
jgi:hypothetical protein